MPDSPMGQSERREIQCPDCDGIGSYERDGLVVKCEWCGATGSVFASDPGDPDDLYERYPDWGWPEAGARDV